MAFSYGFFNAKNMDRVYTAEDFTGYLSSLICNGILDTYGDNFSLTADGLKLTLGTGKAWLNGHYFINDSAYTIDLSQYVEEPLARYVVIGIVCDTAEGTRSVRLEIVKGTASSSPKIPSITVTDTRTILTLYAIRLNANTQSISASSLIDYRADEKKCGYVKCILGKCRVTELLSEMAQANASLAEMIKQMEVYKNQVAELQMKVDDLTGDIVSTGQCGENIYYVLYSNGKLLLRGTGATYNYSNDNRSPFYDNNDITSVTVSSGITAVGDELFEDCEQLILASLPTTLTAIGSGAFTMNDNIVGAVHGLTTLTIPSSVRTIGRTAFWGCAISSVAIPSSVTEIGDYAFRECANLKTARIEGVVMGAFMFTDCINLESLTISAKCKTFGANMLTYCKKLTTITFEGTKSQWTAISKPNNWISSAENYYNDYLQRIECTDGAFIWNDTTNTFEEEA